MPRTYYTLVRWDADNKVWEDDFGSYDREEIVGEVEFCGYVKAHCRIVKTDGTLASLQAAIAALAPRK